MLYVVIRYKVQKIKIVNNFINLSGSSTTNKQFPSFDEHDSHWDTDALDNLVKHGAGPIFLMTGNSTVDQPNDN